MKTMILIATQQLRGGVIAKGEGEPTRFVLESGEELTAAARKALGLDKEMIEDLTTRGVLAEVSARSASGDGPTEAELNAAIKRGDDAEAKVATHEASLKTLNVQHAAALALLTDEQKKTVAATKPAA